MGEEKTKEIRFRTIYNDHSEAILKYALRRTYQPEDAADIVAETFLIAWRKFDQIPKGIEAKYWLYAVARKTLSSHSRKITSQKNITLLLKETLRVSEPNSVNDVSTTRIVVENSMKTLDPDELELFKLSAWDGLNSKEIAKILGVSPVTVRTRLHRARSKMKKSLGKQINFSEHLGTSKHIGN